MTASLVTDLPAAIARHVHDGDRVFIGGFGHAVPFAAGHELIRQGRRDLTLCRSGTDILFDQLIAAGCARRVIFGYLGNPGVGIAHAFARAVVAGTIEVEEWTNYAMMLRLHAAASGIPFLPARILRDGDVAGASCDLRTVTCPYTGEELAAIPALHADVAIIHAQRATEAGDVQMWGVLGDTIVGALASQRILVTVEEVVPASVLTERPDRTVLPGYRVSAVCVAPGGARPSWVDGFYGRDDAAFVAWDGIARDRARLEAFLQAIRDGRETDDARA